MTGLINILYQNPTAFLIIALSLVISISIHEFAHAYMAFKLGDYTAKDLGRLTLNPLAHLDIIGTFSILFLGFGWGKPVPVNYYALKNPKKDMALIALAGPASNFLLAITLTLIIKTAQSINSLLPATILFPVYVLIIYNIALGVFNMLPLDPLDGFKIVNGLLPQRLSIQWVQTAPYGIFLLLLLMATGWTQKIIYPLVGIFVKLLAIDFLP